MSLTKPFNDFPLPTRQNQLHKYQQSLPAHHPQTPASSAASMNITPPSFLRPHCTFPSSSKALCSSCHQGLAHVPPSVWSTFYLSFWLHLRSCQPNPSFGSRLGCLIPQVASSEPCEDGPGAPALCSHSTLCLPATALATLNAPVSPTLSLPHLRLEMTVRSGALSPASAFYHWCPAQCSYISVEWVGRSREGQSVVEWGQRGVFSMNILHICVHLSGVCVYPVWSLWRRRRNPLVELRVQPSFSK